MWIGVGPKIWVQFVRIVRSAERASPGSEPSTNAVPTQITVSACAAVVAGQASELAQSARVRTPAVLLTCVTRFTAALTAASASPMVIRSSTWNL